MRAIFCKIINGHDWKQEQRFGSQYIYVCSICGKTKRVNVINGKEVKVRY